MLDCVVMLLVVCRFASGQTCIDSPSCLAACFNDECVVESTCVESAGFQRCCFGDLANSCSACAECDGPPPTECINTPGCLSGCFSGECAARNDLFFSCVAAFGIEGCCNGAIAPSCGGCSECSQSPSSSISPGGSPQPSRSTSFSSGLGSHTITPSISPVTATPIPQCTRSFISGCVPACFDEACAFAFGYPDTCVASVGFAQCCSGVVSVECGSCPECRIGPTPATSTTSQASQTQTISFSSSPSTTNILASMSISASVSISTSSLPMFSQVVDCADDDEIVIARALAQYNTVVPGCNHVAFGLRLCYNSFVGTDVRSICPRSCGICGPLTPSISPSPSTSCPPDRDVALSALALRVGIDVSGCDDAAEQGGCTHDEYSEIVWDYCCPTCSKRNHIRTWATKPNQSHLA